MEILSFITGYWDGVLLVILAIAALAWLIYKRRWGVLKEILFGLVTEAEREYGASTGELKKAKVIEWLYPRIPAIIRAFITEQQLEDMVNRAVQEAKLKWHTTPELIEEEKLGADEESGEDFDDDSEEESEAESADEDSYE